MEFFFRTGYMLLGIFVSCLVAYWMWKSGASFYIELYNMPRWINEFVSGALRAICSFASWAFVVFATICSHDMLEKFRSQQGGGNGG